MSRDDQARWDARYAQGAYEARPHPSAYLTTVVPERIVGPGRALDVACGRGRNSYYLARHGFQVTALDVSGVALAHAERGRAEDWVIEWRQVDLDDGLGFAAGTFDLILMVRYVSETVLSQLPALLRPGGLLVVEEHLQFESTTPLSGPRSARFRVASGALAGALENAEVDVLESFEGLIEEPDGTTAALARLLARKPSPA